MTKLELKEGLLAILIVFGFVWGFGGPFNPVIASDMEKIEKVEIVTINGKISIKGNEPHTYLSLTTDNHIEYQLTGDYGDKIREEYQRQVMTLEGKITRKALGPGFPALFHVQRIIFIDLE